MTTGAGTKRREAALNRLKAMADPLRAEILLILTEETTSPARMSKRLKADVGSVSYHTKRLVKLGCVQKVREGRVRGAIEHFYRATERHLVETEEWEALTPELKEHLAGEFGQKILDDIVLGLKAKTLGMDENFHLTRTRLVFDEQGRREALEIHERLRMEIEEVQARSLERLAKSDEEGVPHTSLQGCFEVPAP